MREAVAQLVHREGLEQVVVDAARDQVAIEAHVIDLACRDYDRAGLAYFSESVDVVERIAALRQVHEQDLRACGDGQRLHGIAQATARRRIEAPSDGSSALAAAKSKPSESARVRCGTNTFMRTAVCSPNDSGA